MVDPVPTWGNGPGGGTALNAVNLNEESTAIRDLENATEVVFAVGNSSTALTLNYGNGTTQTVTLTGNCTFTLSGAVSGQISILDLILTQDGTGSRTAAWPASVKWFGGAPLLSSAPGSIDRVRLTSYDGGTTWLGQMVGKSYGLRPLLLSQVPLLRGVNWYGMDQGLRGPTLAELQVFKARGYNMVRLPTNWATTTSQVTPILADAVTAGIYIGVEVHNFGRIGGTADVNASDGTAISSSNQSTWFSRCTTEYAAFGSYPSWVPLDMNEPKQTGSVWEPITQGRVAALRTAGYTGVIGVSAAQLSSAGAINNSTSHPGGWWITDTNSFLEVHHYLSPLSDASLQNQATLDAWVVSSSGQSDLKTYIQYINRAFYFGAMGDSRWTNVPMIVGEWTMPPGCEVEFNAFLNECDNRRVGAVVWAAGMWPSTYAWRMNEAQFGVLTRHTNVY